MEQLIWYNFKHNCFKSKFGYLPYNFEVGNRNGFDEELVCTYNLVVVKTKTSFRHTFSHFLKKLFKHKDKVVYVYIDKSRYPFWKR